MGLAEVMGGRGAARAGIQAFVRRVRQHPHPRPCPVRTPEQPVCLQDKKLSTWHLTLDS